MPLDEDTPPPFVVAFIMFLAILIGIVLADYKMKQEDSNELKLHLRK